MRRRMPAGRIDFYNETRMKLLRRFARFDERVRDRKNFTERLAAVFGEENASRKGCHNKSLIPARFALYHEQ